MKGVTAMLVIAAIWRKLSFVFWAAFAIYMVISVFPVLWEIPFSKNSGVLLHNAPYQIYNNLINNGKAVKRYFETASSDSEVAKGIALAANARVKY